MTTEIQNSGSGRDQRQLVQEEQVRQIVMQRAMWLKGWRDLPVTAEMQPAELLSAGTPAISALNAGTGSREIGISVLELAIIAITEWFGEAWDENKRRLCAELMHTDYHWLHLAELSHFIEQARKGVFNVKLREGDVEYDGKMYGRLTPPTLLRWMGRYADASMEARKFRNWDAEAKKKATEAKAALPAGKYVDPELVFAKLREFVDEMGGAQKDAEADYRAEKIKLRQKQARPDDNADPQLQNPNHPLHKTAHLFEKPNDGNR